MRAIPLAGVPYCASLLYLPHDTLPPQSDALGVFEPPRTSDCTVVVVSGGLGSTRCEDPSPVLVVTELRELVF